MNSIDEILLNIKNNISYFTDTNDTFDIVIEKIIKKLKENGVVIKNKDYEIMDFKENFSKVAFKINIENSTEILEEKIILIIQNSDFFNNIITSYDKTTKLYLINKLELSLDKFTAQKEDKVTKNQLSFLRDKMEDKECMNIIREELKNYGIDSVENLTKKQASSILNIIQPQNNRKSRYDRR